MKKAREIAFLGIITALSVVILFLGRLLEILDISAVIIAALLLLIAYEELKLKSLMVYFATAIISSVLFFGLVPIEYIVIAIYPVLKPLIEKAPKVLTYFIKAIYILLASAGMVAIMYFFIGDMAKEPLMIALYVLLFILVIVLFDVLLKKFKLYYRFKLRHMLRLDKFFK
ncbi:MAG: hypothetical protein J6A96_02170 [Clostridia bacterium]|nr:hypothetical protein [Clostridia bacterium]